MDNRPEPELGVSSTIAASTIRRNFSSVYCLKGCKEKVYYADEMEKQRVERLCINDVGFWYPASVVYEIKCIETPLLAIAIK